MQVHRKAPLEDKKKKPRIQENTACENPQKYRSNRKSTGEVKSDTRWERDV